MNKYKRMVKGIKSTLPVFYKSLNGWHLVTTITDEKIAELLRKELSK